MRMGMEKSKDSVKLKVSLNIYFLKVFANLNLT